LLVILLFCTYLYGFGAVELVGLVVGLAVWLASLPGSAWILRAAGASVPETARFTWAG
jgi:hypothetical protein